MSGQWEGRTLHRAQLNSVLCSLVSLSAASFRYDMLRALEPHFDLEVFPRIDVEQKMENKVKQTTRGGARNEAKPRTTAQHTSLC